MSICSMLREFPPISLEFNKKKREKMLLVYSSLQQIDSIFREYTRCLLRFAIGDAVL